MTTAVMARFRTVGSGKRLADSLGARVFTNKVCPKKKYGKGDVIINFGISTPPPYLHKMEGATIINPFRAVRLAVDKRLTLDVLRENGIKCVSTFSNLNNLAHWFMNDPSGTRFALLRTRAKGSKGAGITVVRNLEELNSVLLSQNDKRFKMICAGFLSNAEYRVHVVGGKAIDCVQKKRMSKAKREAAGIEKVDPIIRSHGRGWVFCRKNIKHFQEIEDAAVKSVAALGLDFGAVDIMAKLDGDNLVSYQVCEVNTAPGLSGATTLAKYKEAFEELLDKY